MEPTIRSHIRGLIEQIDQAAQTGLEEGILVVYSQFGDGGRLYSDAMIKAAVRVMEKDCSKFISKMIDEVGTVEQALEAFAFIRDGFNSFMQFLREQLDAVVETAVGPHDNIIHRPDMEDAGAKYFGPAADRMKSQLEAHAVPFSLARPPVRSILRQLPSALAAADERKNRGGRPLAEHWDEMWADIAVKLWAGDLESNTQADIERTMHDWLAARDLDAGDTTVRARARKLWDKMKASE